MGEETKPENQEESEAASTKPKKKISVSTLLKSFFLFLAIIGLLSTFVTSFVLTIGGTEKKKEETQTKVTDAITEIGTLYRLEPFVVNLLDFGGRRFLRFAVEVEVEGADTRELDKKLPYVRNIVINSSTNKTFDMIKTIEGKDTIRNDIVLRLNDILAQTTVRNVFFTEFTAQ